MIPKKSGGAGPQDQRPITVLEMLYRICATATITLTVTVGTPKHTP